MTALLLAVVLAVAACGGSNGPDENAGENGAGSASGPVPEWPAPDNPMELVEAAGLEPQQREHLQTHRHSHLDIFFNGDEITVPAAIGIDITDPDVQYFDTPDGPSYGGIQLCVNPCISPLHTHDETGILHTEAASDDIHTLGQFFVEWDVRLDRSCAGDYCAPETDIVVYVNGDRFDGNPADIQLEDRTQIAIVIGTPPDRIPDEADFSQA